MPNIEELFDAFSDDVHSFLVYYTQSLDVDDLVQETFLKAMKGLSNFEGRSNPRTWLLQIARNVAIDDSRKKHRREFAVDHKFFLEMMASDKSPEQLIELQDTALSLLTALSDMKPHYRQVIIYRTMFELSTEETAKVLGWSLNKVRVTLHRALTTARRLSHESE